MSYEVSGYCLDTIRNRNELRVAEVLRQELPRAEGFCACRLCVEDCFAAALNQLPSQYAQVGSIMLQKHPPEEAIRAEVQKAIERVRAHPKHPSEPVPSSLSVNG